MAATEELTNAQTHCKCHLKLNVKEVVPNKDSGVETWEKPFCLTEIAKGQTNPECVTNPIANMACLIS